MQETFSNLSIVFEQKDTRTYDVNGFNTKDNNASEKLVISEKCYALFEKQRYSLVNRTMRRTKNMHEEIRQKTKTIWFCSPLSETPISMIL